MNVNSPIIVQTSVLMYNVKDILCIHYSIGLLAVGSWLCMFRSLDLQTLCNHCHADYTTLQSMNGPCLNIFKSLYGIYTILNNK